MDSRCEFCKYYDAELSVCRRYAPRATTGLEQSGPQHPAWPMVQKQHDWCGEFTAKKKEAPEGR